MTVAARWSKVTAASSENGRPTTMLLQQRWLAVHAAPAFIKVIYGSSREQGPGIYQWGGIQIQS